MLPDGGFVAGDTDSKLTSYAYPTSPHAIVAKKYAKHVAEDMLAAESVWMRKIPSVADYDARNWTLLDGENSNA